MSRLVGPKAAYSGDFSSAIRPRSKPRIEDKAHRVVNVVGASCKSQDSLRAKQAAKIVEALNIGELSSCQSLNQETRGDYYGETCCGSHYAALVNLIGMFAAVIEELDMILEDGSFVED
ncbi:hypothetical protein RHMOL_Rhmol07G0251600 [Rhododendron molle]|uniref:Uncharacterized protein n=1 Tax=Rhododendron molle TaxID=49168 RepID=A0ACC0N6L6_RHOML|nr:hypothetical protein RHMOL_Rhmol07G0251600 [Rhododendron molle]